MNNNQSSRSDTPKTPFVDQSRCIGCVLCTQMCPNTFIMNDDGKSEVFEVESVEDSKIMLSGKRDLDTSTQSDSQEKIQDSIDACPVACIRWK